MGVTLEVALGMQTMKGLQPNDRGLQPTMVKIAETSGIRNLVRQCRFGRFNGPSSGANSLVELAKPTPFSTFHTDLGHLISKLQNFVIVCFVLYSFGSGIPMRLEPHRRIPPVFELILLRRWHRFCVLK